MPIIPNLFRDHDTQDAVRLYSLYLSRLMAESRERRVIDACHKIRNYAAHMNQSRSADFTFHFEIDALCKLGRFADAWKRLRRLERIAYGRNIRLSPKRWEPEQLDWFWSYHPHILYFLGRYQVAGAMLEALLAERMAHPEEGLSYQLLPHIYKPIARPRDRQEVTLYQVYRKLGKKLSEWSGWDKFVNGFNPKVFSLARIQREDLLRDASLLRPFYEAIEKERKQRLTANVSAGERELTDSLEEVRQVQKDISAKRALQDPVITKREKQLRKMFPELQHLREK